MASESQQNSPIDSIGEFDAENEANKDTETDQKSETDSGKGISAEEKIKTPELETKDQGKNKIPKSGKSSAGSNGKGQVKMPTIPPGMAQIGRIPSPTLNEVKGKENVQCARLSARLKNPPNALRLTTVSLNARTKPNTPAKLRSSYIETVNAKKPRKVVTWDEAMNARPPLRIDMEGPTPCSYTICNRPLKETIAPSWSMRGRTFVEKDGGGRTSWEKTWFQSSNVWAQKVDFYHENTWPAPPHYESKPTLGPKQANLKGFPSHSIGVRRKTNLYKTGAESEPSPNEYDRLKADLLVLKNSPSYSHGSRQGGTVLWSFKEFTPGPGAYTPNMHRVKSHKPAFTIKGIRREKTHEFGPFATL